MSNPSKYEIGKTYVFFVPPSWLIGGTVVAKEGDNLVIDDCVYLEGVNSGYSLVGSVALAPNAKEIAKVVGRSWPLPNGTLVHCDGILLAMPCLKDLKSLARAADAAEIKGTK